MSVHKSRLQLELEIEGKGRFPIVQFGSDWALNSIPTASCLLAVGRKMSDGVTVSAAHRDIWSLRRKDKARVWFRAQGDYDGANDWPQGEFVIFEGRIAGVGKQVTSGKLFLSVSLIHWLSYLDSASALSASAHPDNPMQLSFAALVNSAIQAGTIKQPATMFQTAVASHFQTGWVTVATDLWGEGFKPMFCRLLNEPTMSFAHPLVGCVPDILTEVRQPEMLDALARISGSSTTETRCNSTRPDYAPPLRLTDAAGLPFEAVVALGNAVGNEMMQSFAGQTMWSKLLYYGSQFMFSVVPLIDRAIVVPFIPTSQSLYCKELTANDNDVEQFSSRISRTIRAVAVFTSSSSASGLNKAISANGFAGLAGCYHPEDADDKGLIWTVPAPTWLAGLRHDGLSAVKTAGIRKKLLNSATTPRAVDADLEGRDGDKTGVFLSTSELFSAYAQAVYGIEVLRGRTGQVSGHLRFDISPGSMVRVKSVGEPFVVADELRDTLIGAVTGVAIGINAESAAAGTSFRVEYCRTEEENESDATSMVRNPLYLDVFRGAPLSDHLQFGECREP